MWIAVEGVSLRFWRNRTDEGDFATSTTVVRAIFTSFLEANAERQRECMATSACGYPLHLAVIFKRVQHCVYPLLPEPPLVVFAATDVDVADSREISDALQSQFPHLIVLNAEIHRCLRPRLNVTPNKPESCQGTYCLQPR